MRVAIVGGGVAGLAAAYELEKARRAGAGVEYALFESSSRLGGVISSRNEDGTVMEHGPDSFLTEKPAAITLCRELGLGDSLIGSDDSNRKTFILVRNRLVALPDGLMFLVPTQLTPTLLTPLFSPMTKMRMGLEWFRRARTGQEDESVASFVRRHYGQAAVDRLADPLLSGIYGGDAEHLSVQSVLPAMVRLETEYGSLTRGMLAARRKQREAARHAPPSATKRTIFTTLRGGLQQLIDALVAELEPQSLRVDAAVQSLEVDSLGWRLRFAARATERFDGVILATPAWVAAQLVRGVHGPLSDELASIPYSSSITVNFVFDEAPLPTLPPGFGFLVPTAERRSMLACTFVHRKFPGRTAPGRAVLRCFAGGMRGEQMLAESDAEIERVLREELRQILRIDTEPLVGEVRRWPRSMAQYSVGHATRVRRIREQANALCNLHLAGNAYDGIGISDCIRLGQSAARALVQIEA
jgi:oxygen-dependent protoporphyrinogen oxidase